MVDDRATRKGLVNTCADHLLQLSRQHDFSRESSNLWSKFLRALVKRFPSVRHLLIGKRLGNRVAVIYLIIKFLYLANAIGQLFIIKTFIGHRGGDPGIIAFACEFFNSLKGNHEWGGNEFFPRQTLCRVGVPHLGVRRQFYTAVCALPVNIFNEKIYAFLWVWISFVACVAGISCIFWIYRVISLQCRPTGYLHSFLSVSFIAQLTDSDKQKPETKKPEGQKPEEQEPTPQESGEEITMVQASTSQSSETTLQDNDLSEESVKRFLEETVRCDGGFIIRMLRGNAGDVVAGEILVQWWKLSRKAFDGSGPQIIPY